MKIFNWVHRRFNNKAENAKKDGDIGEDDKQFLQVENKCNVFECWRGGILTIGTLGYDPLKDESAQIMHDISNYLYEDDAESDMEQVLSAQYECHDEMITDSEEEVENDDDEEDEDEENPLIFAAYEQDVEDLMEENGAEEFGFEYVMMEKKARTTLADLFYADSEDMNKKHPLKKGEVIKEKSKCKHGFSFGKKLMLEDARPIHKLQQLMRRMLKRKIHPDMGHANSKVAVVKKCDFNDHASLLPTQDAII